MKEHCWHVVSFKAKSFRSFTVDVKEEICCFCGSRQTATPVVDKNHGPHTPPLFGPPVTLEFTSGEPYLEECPGLLGLSHPVD